MQAKADRQHCHSPQASTTTSTSSVRPATWMDGLWHESEQPFQILKKVTGRLPDHSLTIAGDTFTPGRTFAGRRAREK